VLTGKYLLLVSSMLIKIFFSIRCQRTRDLERVPRFVFTQSCRLTSCGFSLESDIFAQRRASQEVYTWTEPSAFLPSLMQPSLGSTITSCPVAGWIGEYGPLTTICSGIENISIVDFVTKLIIWLELVKPKRTCLASNPPPKPANYDATSSLYSSPNHKH
jgi:hypothetical protein